MATKIERSGIEACVSKINTAIESLQEAATDINKSMEEIPNYWEGDAYNKARDTYESEYKTLLTNTVPTAVENFRDYINQCMEKIIELDQQLAGG